MRCSALPVRATTLACVVGALVACSGPATTPSPSPSPSASVTVTSSPSPTPSPTETFDTFAHPLDEPASVWVIVNKVFRITPADWVPPDLVAIPGVPEGANYQLREPAAHALTRLSDAAAAAGAGFRITSAYRSYAYQKGLYDPRARDRGAAVADRTTARPGYSEHQTGLATDVYDTVACRLQQCFGGTAAGTFVAEHAWEYGFVIRYPQDKEGVTGYVWEPWHLRYVGTELAKAMHDSGVTTLEEFFGLPPAPEYPAGPGA